MALFSLVPILLYLIVLRTFDAFSMVRWRTMGVWTAWGVVSALLLLCIVKASHATGCAWTAPWVSPVIEEIVKAFPLLIIIWQRKAVFTAETQLYGEAIGGGFALVENVIYLHQFPNMSVATALVRGLGTGLLHMGCTALVATLMLLVVQHLSHRMTSATLSSHSLHSIQALVALPLIFLPSMAIHTFHNVSPLSPMTFMIGMIVVFFMAFYLISCIGERSIIRWLDVSIGDDVQLIASLQQGKLAETKAGAYLTQLRHRFEPLVFFDMCVYVQLYLELLIKAKARIMLRDAGIKADETPQQKADRRACLNELDAIAHRIPKMGMQLLRPLIIHNADQDEWVLRRD